MNWTQATCVLYVRLCYKTSKTITFTEDELEFFEENSVTSIKDLIDLPKTTLKNLENSQRIKEEVIDIQKRYKKKSDIFLAVTKSPYPYTDYRTGERTYRDYYHWLPLHQSRLLCEDCEEYDKFDTLVHVTHIDKAEIIFENSHLQVNPVADNSVFSKIPGHPNQSTKVIWFGPGVKANVAVTNSRYGNVAFCMDNLNGTTGLYSPALKYYFVEVIDYYKSSACRILVTTKTYPQLRPYNPTKKGGPWYYDIETDQHYWLKDVVRYDGTRGFFGNSLEIMREVDTSPGDDFQKNLTICPVLHLMSQKCLGGHCHFLHDDDSKSYDYRFYTLAALHNPIFSPTDQLIDKVKDQVGNHEDDDEDDNDDEEDTSDGSSDDQLTHNVYQAFLLDVDIDNVKSKVLFWKNIKTSVKRITGQPYTKEALREVCDQDNVLESKLLSIIFEIIKEMNNKNARLEYEMNLLKQFPYSLFAVLKSSQYFQKHFQ